MAGGEGGEHTVGQQGDRDDQQDQRDKAQALQFAASLRPDSLPRGSGSVTIPLAVATRTIGVRIPAEDQRWVTELAQRNQVTVSAMIRALLHGLHIMAAEGQIEALPMGELRFVPSAMHAYRRPGSV